jgi:hypothetical protein
MVIVMGGGVKATLRLAKERAAEASQMVGY